MAKKRKRRRTSLLTKAINLGVMVLAFSTPLRIIIQNPNRFGAEEIVRQASAGLVKPGGKGAFDVTAATAFYGPMVAAIILKKAVSMVRRSVRI